MADNIFDERENIKRTIKAQREAGKPQVKKPQKRRKKTKKGKKPLCQTNIFIQCPATSKSVRKKTDNALIRRGRKLPPRKSQTQIEVEAEEKRRKLAQQDRFLELEDFRQQREFVRADRDRQQRELQRQTDFISGQNRIAADAQIAQFNQQQENLRAGQRDVQTVLNRQLEQDRLDLQRREINARQIENRRQRGLEHRKINIDVDKYNADVRRAEINRDRDIALRERELVDLRERVARDDAFRHRQLEETQRLAFEQLAEQRRDNTTKRELESRKIDNQRAVDAERAITDREKEQTIQSALDALRHQEPPEKIVRVVPQETQTETPEAEPETAFVGQTPAGQTPARLQRRAEFLETGAALSPPTLIAETGEPKKPETPRTPETPGTVGSGVARRAQKAAVAEGLRTNPDEVGDLALSEASSSLSSGSTTGLTGLSPSLQRAAAIQTGREVATPRTAKKLGREPGTPVFTTKTGEVKPAFSEGERERIKARARKREEKNLRSAPEPETNLKFEEILEGSPPSGLRGEEEQETIVQRAGGVVAEGARAAGAAVGGAVGGVAQGLAEQLPAASDVGAAVGRGGVRLVGGLAGAAFRGLRGEPQPGEQTGGRLDPRGEVVGLGREIESPERQP